MGLRFLPQLFSYFDTFSPETYFFLKILDLKFDRVLNTLHTCYCNMSILRVTVTCQFYVRFLILRTRIKLIITPFPPPTTSDQDATTVPPTEPLHRFLYRFVHLYCFIPCFEDVSIFLPFLEHRLGCFSKLLTSTPPALYTRTSHNHLFIRLCLSQ